MTPLQTALKDVIEKAGRLWEGPGDHYRAVSACAEFIRTHGQELSDILEYMDENGRMRLMAERDEARAEVEKIKSEVIRLAAPYEELKLWISVLVGE